MNRLFIWIPKTGGTSLFEQIKFTGTKLYLENNIHEFKNEGDSCFGHIDVRQLLKHKIISKEYWQNSKAFAVVRNPYHRFVSLYNDFLKSGRIFPGTSIRKFATILQNVERVPGLYNTKGFSQCSSQVDWLFPGVEIKRFEDITKDLPHLNRSTERDHMSYYDSELLKMIEDLYADDFAILGYDYIR